MALRNRRKTGLVVFFGLFFFAYFLLEEQKKVTISQKEKWCPFETPSCIFVGVDGIEPPFLQEYTDSMIC